MTPAFSKWRQDKEELHANIVSMIEEGIKAGEFVPCDARLAREVVTALSTETIRLHDVLPENSLRGPAARSSPFVLRALMVDPEALDEVRAQAVEAGASDWSLGASR